MSQTRVTPHVFSLDKGKTFVGGLFWQVLPGQDGEKSEIRALAKELDMNLGVALYGQVHQVGLGSTDEGLKAGMMSSAAAVAKHIHESGLGPNALIAAEIEKDVWQYVSVHDGAILPTGDIIASEDTVRAELFNQHSLGSWNTIVAPVHWGLPGAKEVSFVDLLPRTGKTLRYHSWWELKAINGGGLRALLGNRLVVGVIVAGVALAVMSGIKSHQAKRAAEALAAQQMQQAADAAQQAAKPLPPPWHSKPTAAALAAACTEAFAKLRVAPGGWKTESVTCAPSGMTTLYARVPYVTAEHLAQAGVEAAISENGEKATVVTPVTSLQPGQEQLQPAAMVTAHLQTRIQQLGHDIQMQQVQPPQPPPPPPGVQQAPPPPPPTWLEYQWNVHTLLSPIEFVQHINMPGLRLERMTWSSKNGINMWHFEGTQYGQK